MQIIHDLGNVRVVRGGPHEIKVQVNDGPPFNDWATRASFDTMSDDYAFSNAREYAEKLATKRQG
jgi:hypothetical protein